jgi:hypothetical protein
MTAADIHKFTHLSVQGVFLTAAKNTLQNCSSKVITTVAKLYYYYGRYY